MIGTKRKQLGFSTIEIVLAFIVIGAIAATGLLLYQRYKPTAATNTTHSTNQQKGTTATQAQPDPYAGWKTYCDSTVRACIKYPSDWVASKYGGWENPSCTEYVLLSGPTSKDGGAGDAYIASIKDLSTPVSDLKILGMVINNYPTYSIYNTSYINENNIQVGTTRSIAYVNHRFTGRTGDAGLAGTPCANGSVAITTFDQAKAWFNTTDSKTVLKVVQSFYYQ